MKTLAPTTMVLHLIEKMLKSAREVGATALKITAKDGKPYLVMTCNGAPVPLDLRIGWPIMPAISSRLKVMAGISIARKGEVQHGKATSRVRFTVVTTGDLIGPRTKFDEILVLFPKKP
jgi:type II secretory ATPase GspE/PulE/Tfp pilus assembly ATPase PilB-like protein